jgi:HSP20 family protein
MMSNVPSGLSVSEDDRNVYIEAAVPGVDPKDIDVTFEKGMLRIVAEAKKEEKEDRKYFRRALRSFSYQVSIPTEVDLNTEPQAEVKEGIMVLTFTKSEKMQPKKISVKTGK